MHHLAVASEVYYLCPSFQLFAPFNTKKLVSKHWTNLINFLVFDLSIITACYHASMFLSLYIFYHNVLAVICYIHHPGMARSSGKISDSEWVCCSVMPEYQIF